MIEEVMKEADSNPPAGNKTANTHKAAHSQ